MTAHAKLSASSSSRWLNCPGSVAACANIQNTSSSNALEGSVAHALAEYCLKTPANPYDLEGKTLPEYPDFPIPNEMCRYISDYIDYLTEIGGVQEYEVRIDYSHLVVNGFGTADCVALVGTTLHVVDLKYGKGVFVSAQDNSQLRLYGLGALELFSGIYDVQTVALHIFQPRIDNIDCEEISTNDLIQYGEWVRERAKLTEAPDAERVAGDKQCQWCLAKGTCPELKRHTEEALLMSFDNLEEAPALQNLTDQDLSRILQAAPLIRAFLEAVYKEVETKLINGEPFDGFKLVHGRSSRKWDDTRDTETELLQRFPDLSGKLYEQSLLSPAKLEKLLTKDERQTLSELVVKTQGKITIAPASDPRPPVNAKTCSADDFESLDD